MAADNIILVTKKPSSRFGTWAISRTMLYVVLFLTFWAIFGVAILLLILPMFRALKRDKIAALED